MAHHPANASNARTTHTTATSPASAMRHSAKPTSMPVCRRIRAARVAMPTRAILAAFAARKNQRKVWAAQLSQTKPPA
jgi:hypothetical protein